MVGRGGAMSGGSSVTSGRWGQPHTATSATANPQRRTIIERTPRPTNMLALPARTRKSNLRANIEAPQNAGPAGFRARPPRSRWRKHDSEVSQVPISVDARDAAEHLTGEVAGVGRVGHAL